MSEQPRFILRDAHMQVVGIYTVSTIDGLPASIARSAKKAIRRLGTHADSAWEPVSHGWSAERAA